MFLQVFEYKADSSIYIFIVFAWIIYLIQNSVRVVAYIFGSMGLFIPYIIVHLLLSLMGAPICQLIFVVYVAYALVGSPSNLKDLGLSFIFKTVKSFFVDVEIDTLKSVASSNTTILGGFDNLAYLYGYRYFTFFIFMLFFFFKTIQGAIELKIRAIRTSISSTNAYITATMLVIYFAKYLNDEPVPTQEFTIGKKANPEVPAAQGLDGAAAEIGQVEEAYSNVQPNAYPFEPMPNTETNSSFFNIKNEASNPYSEPIPQTNNTTNYNITNQYQPHPFDR